MIKSPVTPKNLRLSKIVVTLCFFLHQSVLHNVNLTKSFVPRAAQGLQMTRWTKNPQTGEWELPTPERIRFPDVIGEDPKKYLRSPAAPPLASPEPGPGPLQLCGICDKKRQLGFAKVLCNACVERNFPKEYDLSEKFRGFWVENTAGWVKKERGAKSRPRLMLPTVPRKPATGVTAAAAAGGGAAEREEHSTVASTTEESACKYLGGGGFGAVFQLPATFASMYLLPQGISIEETSSLVGKVVQWADFCKYDGPILFGLAASWVCDGIHTNSSGQAAASSSFEVDRVLRDPIAYWFHDSEDAEHVRSHNLRFINRPIAFGEIGTGQSGATGGATTTRLILLVLEKAGDMDALEFCQHIQNPIVDKSSSATTDIGVASSTSNEMSTASSSCDTDTGNSGSDMCQLLLRQKRRNVIKILDDVISAVGEFHERGLLVADLKAENVMVTLGREETEKSAGIMISQKAASKETNQVLRQVKQAQLIDFGLVLRQSDETFHGTPKYAPFKYANAAKDYKYCCASAPWKQKKNCCRESDVFSLGALAFEMFLGKAEWRKLRKRGEMEKLNYCENFEPIIADETGATTTGAAAVEANNMALHHSGETTIASEAEEASPSSSDDFGLEGVWEKQFLANVVLPLLQVNPSCGQACVKELLARVQASMKEMLMTA